MRDIHFNNAGDDVGASPSNILSFQHEDECEDDIRVNNRDNQSIPPMVGSRRSVDPLTSLAPILPRVPSEDVEPPVETETSFRANMSGPHNKEEVLPRTMSLQQYYSPIHDNNDNIDDNNIGLFLDTSPEVCSYYT